MVYIFLSLSLCLAPVYWLTSKPVHVKNLDRIWNVALITNLYAVLTQDAISQVENFRFK